jgi:hypothetical protein
MPDYEGLEARLGERLEDLFDAATALQERIVEIEAALRAYATAAKTGPHAAAAALHDELNR